MTSNTDSCCQLMQILDTKIKMLAIKFSVKIITGKKISKEKFFELHKNLF